MPPGRVESVNGSTSVVLQQADLLYIQGASSGDDKAILEKALSVYSEYLTVFVFSCYHNRQFIMWQNYGLCCY